MTEAQWLTSENLERMVEWLLLDCNTAKYNYPPNYPHCPVAVSDRKLRLFVVACCRQVWDSRPCRACDGSGLLYPEGTPYPVFEQPMCLSCGGTGKVGGLTNDDRHAVEVAEMYADGLATIADLNKAEQSASTDWQGSGNPAGPAWYSCSANITYAAQRVVRPEMRNMPPQAVKADLLRCLFGNPWRPVSVGYKTCPECGGGGFVEPWGLTDYTRECYTCNFGGRGKMPGKVPAKLDWRSPLVLSMAQAIYAKRRFEDMPVLSDALEEAGCADEAILAHGRCSGPHARGCWVLDLLLGKE